MRPTLLKHNLISGDLSIHDVMRDMCDYLRFDLPHSRIDGYHKITMYSHNRIRMELWERYQLVITYDKDFDEQAEEMVITIYLTQKARDLATLEML